MTLESRLFDAFTSRPHPAATDILRAESASVDDEVRRVLTERTVKDLSVEDVNNAVEGNLWALTPAAFLYYLPAFMRFCLLSYRSVSVFASELIGALTEPARSDVVESLERLGQLPPGLALSDPVTAGMLRAQQLEWFDSGTPTAIFHERFDGLSAAEGAAVLAFLEAFRGAHGADFPFGELDAAIDRHWARYRDQT
jgi:hypothetical protein